MGNQVISIRIVPADEEKGGKKGGRVKRKGVRIDRSGISVRFGDGESGGEGKNGAKRF